MTPASCSYIKNASLGKFEGKAYINVYINGGAVNEVVNMTVTLTMTQGFEAVS